MSNLTEIMLAPITSGAKMSAMAAKAVEQSLRQHRAVTRAMLQAVEGQLRLSQKIVVTAIEIAPGAAQVLAD